jgi:hypothetical protein
MAIVQVLFVCKPSADLSRDYRTAAFEVMQSDCHSRNLAGFFLSIPTGYVGFFEAEKGIVFGQIERIVRARKFRDIQVIREIHPRSPACDDWYVSDVEPVAISPEDFLSPEYLANFIRSALKPLSRRLQQ